MIVRQIQDLFLTKILIRQLADRMTYLNILIDSLN